jgi:hypothetical protein
MLEQIPNFPQAFMDRHMNWHMRIPPDGRTVPPGQPGSGAQFLDFHHQFIVDVRNWYASQPGADLSKMTAWTDFPANLAAAHSPELAQFQGYASNASNFTSEDALGIYIEPEHNLIHSYIAALYDTPDFAQFDSCMYFMFYQWHGLIDQWRGNWLVHHKRAIKDHIDKVRIKDLAADKVHIKDLVIDVPKSIVDVAGRVDPGDLLAALSDRVAKLEAVVHRHAFIRGQERPEVR